MQIKILSGVLLIALLTKSTLGLAVPFSISWTDTLNASSTAPYNPGEAVTITVVMDNGGITAASQTWEAADLVSITYTINEAPNIITNVFDLSAASVSGSYQTDAGGALISVADMNDDAIGSDIISSDDPGGTSEFRWWVNSANEVLVNDSVTPAGSAASAINVSSNLQPAAWSNPTPVGEPPRVDSPPTAKPIPTMSAYGLVLTMLGLLVVAGRKLRTSAKCR